MDSSAPEKELWIFSIQSMIGRELIKDTSVLKAVSNSLKDTSIFPAKACAIRVTGPEIKPVKTCPAIVIACFNPSTTVLAADILPCVFSIAEDESSVMPRKSFTA